MLNTLPVIIFSDDAVKAKKDLKPLGIRMCLSIYHNLFKDA